MNPTQNVRAFVLTYVETCVEKEHIRYLFAGSLSTGLTFLIYTSTVLMGFSYLLANSVAWILGVIVSFNLNARFVFRKSYQHKRAIAFVISNIFSYFASTAMLFVLIHFLSVNSIFASMVTIPFIVVVNFCAVKFVVFGRDFSARSATHQRSRILR